MYEIIYYRDRRGKSPIEEYIQKLSVKKDKDSRIKREKINDYFQALEEGGTQIGEPYIKHLKGNIWELRPIRDRILFAAWNGQNFILLHYFIKKTEKTPQHEIEQAERNLTDWKKRSKDDG